MVRTKNLIGQMETLHLLRRVALQKATAELELYYGQLPILEYVSRHEGCTQAELAMELMVSPASIALSTKRMQKSGLLSKAADEDNLRCNKLAITDKGRLIAQQCRDIFDGYDCKTFEGFSSEELDVFASYLSRILKNLTGEELDSDPEHLRQTMHKLRNELRQQRKEED